MKFFEQEDSIQFYFKIFIIFRYFGGFLFLFFYNRQYFIRIKSSIYYYFCAKSKVNLFFKNILV